MIDKIDISSSQPLFEPEASKQQNTKKASAELNMDASLQIDNVSLLASAMQNAATQPDAVAKAKEALLSGRLDRYDNILQAAEDIVKFGI
jgi:hypothetical protein